MGKGKFWTQEETPPNYATHSMTSCHIQLLPHFTMRPSQHSMAQPIAQSKTSSCRLKNKKKKKLVPQYNFFLLGGSQEIFFMAVHDRLLLNT